MGMPSISMLKEGERKGDALKIIRNNARDYDVVITNLFNYILIDFSHPDFIKEFYLA
jgi:spermidine synthase